MPHGGFHGYNKPKTDTKSSPSFLTSKTHKEKVNDFFNMSSKERTDRFNQNQKNLSKSFSKTPSLDDIDDNRFQVEFKFQTSNK